MKPAGGPLPNVRCVAIVLDLELQDVALQEMLGVLGVWRWDLGKARSGQRFVCIAGEPGATQFFTASAADALHAAAMVKECYAMLGDMRPSDESIAWLLLCDQQLKFRIWSAMGLPTEH